MSGFTPPKGWTEVATRPGTNWLADHEHLVYRPPGGANRYFIPEPEPWSVYTAWGAVDLLPTSYLYTPWGWLLLMTRENERPVLRWSADGWTLPSNAERVR